MTFKRKLRQTVEEEDSVAALDLCEDRLDAVIPWCPHGPTLSFTRNAGKKEGKRFYACSACRNRKDCDFFMWEDEKVTPAKEKRWMDIYRRSQVDRSHAELRTRYLKFVKSGDDYRKTFCQTCSLLLLPDETVKHKTHTLSSNITLSNLLQPTFLLKSLTVDKSEAQYWFTDSTSQFVANTIKSLGYSKVLCIGAPRLHEAVLKSDTGLQSFLLDIDHRYGQFYDEKHFGRFNMCNFHFFEGNTYKIVDDFLLGNNGKDVVIVIDPPFGALVNVIKRTLVKFIEMWSRAPGKDKPSELPVMWVFPYFMEQRILSAFPSFSMSDYKVCYSNHANFREKKGLSPIRIFTNIDRKKIILPVTEGYRLCKKCEVYVAESNKHCAKCGVCPSKDGKTYVHCKLCRTCVKPGYEHCSTCKTCALPSHTCEPDSEGKKPVCYQCGETSHKQKHCPQLSLLKSKKKTDNRPSAPARKKLKKLTGKWRKIKGKQLIS